MRSVRDSVKLLMRVMLPLQCQERAMFPHRRHAAAKCMVVYAAAGFGGGSLGARPAVVWTSRLLGNHGLNFDRANLA